MQVRVPRWSRRRVRERLLAAVLHYAELGWPACLGAHPAADGARACSCDRVGCPAPGAHPVSPSWSQRATVDRELLRSRWADDPDANVILPTGRVFDVFDVPAAAGISALARMDAFGIRTGPVAAYDSQRYLFLVATRGAPTDEDEWWPCHLDAHPAAVPETEGLRWHCRDSYILAPPSVLISGQEACWIRSPEEGGLLPDPLALLEPLADACGEFHMS